jgi:hypothetical protein
MSKCMYHHEQVRYYIYTFAQGTLTFVSFNNEIVFNRKL